MTTIAHHEPARVSVGVDTHEEVHVAVALDQLGRRLGEQHIPANPQGYRRLRAWAESLGEVAGFGIEGTGSYGAGLSRFLTRSGHLVVEVLRPNRQARRLRGKSDPADAEAAARALLSGEAQGRPRGNDGTIEAIRALRVARNGARKARTQAANALGALVVTAPEDLREALRGLSGAQLARRVSRLRPQGSDVVLDSTKIALRALGRRYLTLDEEIRAHDKDLDQLVAEAAPELLARFGVGTDCAGALLVAAGDHPERLGSEAAFAMLCGVGPVDASSGKQQRHRLNRGGDRQANAALYRIVIVRLAHHEETRTYYRRRLEQGKTRAETIRCLKRYVAREIYQTLKTASEQSLETAA